MKLKSSIRAARIRRERRVRAKLGVTRDYPRLSVFRSNRYTYAQVIDDRTGKTLASASSREIKEKGSGVSRSTSVGTLIAERAVKAGVSRAVLDRGRYRYHGRVKALAEAARKAGLNL
jgi:large subunit ribosomal protein L18